MNILKKLTLTTLIATGVTMFSAESLAYFYEDCPDETQECVIDNNPGTGTGSAYPPVWVGTWYDQYGFSHSVYAGSYTKCNILLSNTCWSGDL